MTFYIVLKFRVLNIEIQKLIHYEKYYLSAVILTITQLTTY